MNRRDLLKAIIGVGVATPVVKAMPLPHAAFVFTGADFGSSERAVISYWFIDAQGQIRDLLDFDHPINRELMCEMLAIKPSAESV